MSYTQTIFAPATAPGKAGVAVIRISGPRAVEALQALGCPLPPPRYAKLTELRTPDSELLDHALVLYFPAPHSFTGEDVVELHLHGSRAVLLRLMETLSRLEGLRLAEPGEFSRRAFENGKMDLTQAEGLADLIDAETELQARQALRQMAGELQLLYEGWRSQLIGLLAHIEAYIDFPDEDLPPELVTILTQELTALQNAIARHLQDNRRGERLREGLYVAIIGAPNVGKSSLMNYLAQRDVAIVSHLAGTTRDILEVHLNISGFPVIVADTAGLRESSDLIEEEGIRRARKRAAEADLKIAVFDAEHLAAPDPATLALVDVQTLVVVNKTDRVPARGQWEVAGYPAIGVSLERQEGVPGLLAVLGDYAAEQMGASADPVLTRARHRQALEACQEHLVRFSLDHDIELAAEDLRLAARELGKITGRIDIEEILDALFSNFCIGK